MAPPAIRIQLPRPHSEGQRGLYTYDGNSVVFAGRRYGKTSAGVYRLLKGCAKSPGLYWWVGLSWKSASMKRAWRLLKVHTRQIWQAIGEKSKGYINESNHEIQLPNGSEIWLRTAEAPESLAGEGIMGAVVDEFTLMQEVVWTEYLQATLLDEDGWVMFLGVPKGNNWGANLWRAACDRGPGWRQFHFTSYDNPKIRASGIDAIKGQVSERLFNQEYLALILDDGNGIFRRVQESATATRQDKALASHQYVIGVDWGKLADFTVISVIDLTTGEQCYLDRFNQIDYAVQMERLSVIVDKFQPTSILAERNSMGEPLIEQCQRRGWPVRPFVTTNMTKAEIIDGLGLAFERESLRILPDAVQLAELQAYEATRLPGGLLRYSAPSGLHDDCVMALALAQHAAAKPNMRMLDKLVA